MVESVTERRETGTKPQGSPRLRGAAAAMALLLFSADYYPKFFHEAGKMNLTGELSMAGVVRSLWCLAISAIDMFSMCLLLNPCACHSQTESSWSWIASAQRCKPS